MGAIPTQREHVIQGYIRANASKVLPATRSLLRRRTADLEIDNPTRARRYRPGITTTTATSPSRTRGAQSAQNSADPNAPSLRAEIVTGARSQ
jgi:hypothetical protein